MEQVEQWTTRDNLRVTVRYDEVAGSPREWDNLGTMVCWHGRYNLGDEQPSISPSEYLADLPEGTITLPLYLYDHGGISMSSSPFSCPWDSGQVGFIYVTRETIAKEFPNYTPEDDTIRQYLANEVKTYDTYLSGQVYWYQVERMTTCDKGHEHEELVDSCGGFYGNYGLDEIRNIWPEAVNA